jgi:prepilin-type N-terminal cleavage/methylation domain-containing protein
MSSVMNNHRHRVTGSSRRKRAHGFSLIEVLMAIFILGIGVISIAALFPAGIAQQQRSNDDIIGPLVAQNALTVIRSKVSQDDFGTFEDFTDPTAPPNVALNPALFTADDDSFTVRGDWAWLRPGYIFADDLSTPLVNERGAIDIFSRYYGADPSNESLATEFPEATWPNAYERFGVVSVPQLWGVPWNLEKYWNPLFPGGKQAQLPPRILITQAERYYPQATQRPINGANQFQALPKPQYVWDCMFRRFEGKVYVAIFVYRVTTPGRESAAYVVQQNRQDGLQGLPFDPQQSPLPVRVDLQFDDNDYVAPWNGWDEFGLDRNFNTRFDSNTLAGTIAGTTLELRDERQGWQASGQWLLDQNNKIHRVLSAQRFDSDNPVEVQLVRPVLRHSVFDSSGFSVPLSSALYPDHGLGYYAGVFPLPVVTSIWYLPRENSLGQRLTPVFVTVREL